MIKFLKYFIISSLTILFFNACQKGSEDSDTGQPRVTLAKNTVIVYLLGNNSLSSYVSDNLNKMSSTWSNSFDGHCVVIVDAPYKQLTLVEVGVQTQKTIKTYTDKDPVNAVDMKSLIEDAINLYPAEKYTIVLWSHGLGWLPNYTVPTSVRAFGESAGVQMELKDLADGIPDDTFETIIFDACFMGSIEVAYELRDKSNYMIAAPSEVLAEGFPYHITIPQIMQNKAPENIASSFVEYYRAKASVSYQSATIGVFKMSELETLAQKTKKFYQNFDSPYSLIQNTSNVQIYDFYSPHVFFDFKEMITTLANSKSQEDANAVYEQLSKTIIFEDHTDRFLDGYSIVNCSGVSGYIPINSSVSSKLKSTYQTLSWYEASGSSLLFQ